MSGSASASRVSVLIQAIDKVTGPIARINQQLASMRAPVDRAKKDLARFAEQSGLTTLGRGMQRLAGESLKVFRAIGRVAEPLAAITGAASIAGLVKLTTAWADFGSKLGFTAQRIGIPVEQLSAFQGAAQLAGSSAESLASGMKTLGDNLVNAAAGRAPEAMMVFARFGIALRDANGHVRTATQVLPELADALAKEKTPAIQAQLATMALGGAAEDLLPFLRGGAAGIQEYTDRAKSYGVINERGAAAANELRRRQVELKLSVEGLGYAVSEKLAPVLGPMLESLATWISSNRGIIATDVAGWVKAVVPEVTGFARTVDGIAQKLGGWKTVLEGIAAITLAAWVGRMVASLSPLTLALAAIAETIIKIEQFSDNSQPKNLPVGSPFWRGISEKEQANYVNSPRSQAFLHPHGGNPNPFSWWNPGSWLGRTDGKGPFGGGSPAEQAQKHAADTRMDATKRGFLDTIAGPESRGAYDIKNGGSHFSDYSRFPEGVGPNGTSTAAGRYQITSGTWESLQNTLGLADFSPASQDKAAWYLAQRRYHAATGGRDLEADLRAGNRKQQIAGALGPTWPSLPGGSQSRQSFDQFSTALDRNTAAEVATAPPANIQGGTGTSGAAADAKTVKGSATLDIRFHDAPAGMTTASATSGDFFGAPLLVSHAMGLNGP